MRKNQPATRQVFLLFVLLLALPVWLASYSHVRIVRLSLVEGEVYVARPGEAEWTPGVVNLPLVHDALLETANGAAEVEFESGAFARLATDARLHLAELGLLDTGGRVTLLSLERGTATFYAKLRDDDSFVVQTPYFQVSVAKRAKFRIDVFAEGGRVRVFTGEVNVESSTGTLTVSKDRMFEWHAASGQYLLARNPDDDAWDEWNNDRDNVVHAAAAKAIPAHLTYGLYDLARYGSWQYHPGIGLVWRPSRVAAGWVPFMDGRWLWYTGFGWTWISFEPWGWLPYHYGSWYFDPLRGWVWVPDFFDYWSPARCFWVQRPGWVGWGPLPPRGTFRDGGSTLAQPGKPLPGTVVVSEDGFARGELPKLLKRSAESDGQPWQFGVPPAHELLRSVSGTTGNRPGTPRTDRIEFDPETGRYINRDRPRTRFGTESQQRPGEATTQGGEKREPPRGTFGRPEKPRQPAIPSGPERPRVNPPERPRGETGPPPAPPSRPPVVRPPAERTPPPTPPTPRASPPPPPTPRPEARPPSPPAMMRSQPTLPRPAPQRPPPR